MSDAIVRAIEALETGMKSKLQDVNAQLGHMTKEQADYIAKNGNEILALRKELAETKGYAQGIALAAQGRRAGQVNAAAGSDRAMGPGSFKDQLAATFAKAFAPGGTEKDLKEATDAFAKRTKGVPDVLREMRFAVSVREAIQGGMAIKSASLAGTNLETYNSFLAIQQTGRIQEVFRAPFEGRQVLEALNFQQAPTANQITYVRELDYAACYSGLTAEAASGQPVLAVGNINGFFVGQKVTIQKTSAASEGYPNGVTVEEDRYVLSTALTGTGVGVAGCAGTITLTANLTNTYPANLAAAPSTIFSTTYSPTALTQVKPSGRARTEVKTVDMNTLAELFQISRRQFNTMPVLMNYLEARAMNAGIRSIIKQTFYGDGTANLNGTGTNFLGFFNDPKIPNVKQSTGTPGEAVYAVIRRAILNIRQNNGVASAVMLSPADWADQELAQAGSFAVWQFLPKGATQQLFSVPVIISNDIDNGTGLVGAFNDPLSHCLYEGEGLGMQIFEQAGDNVALNELTVRTEQTAALAITVPSQFCTASFDGVTPVSA